MASNPFTHLPTTELPKGLWGSGGALDSGGGFRQHSIAIPKYIATEGQGEAPIAIGGKDAPGMHHKPAYFRFAMADSTGTGTETTAGSSGERLKNYYGKSRYGHELMTKLRQSKRSSRSYINFLLQNVQEDFQEKHQIVDTFGDSFASFFFGQRVSMITIQAILIDDQLSDAKTQFLYVYNTYLRGFHTAKHKILTEFGYGDTVVKGVMLGVTTGTGSVENEVVTTFNAQMLVYKYASQSSNLSKIYDKNLEDPYDVGGNELGIADTAPVRVLNNGKSVVVKKDFPPVVVDSTPEGDITGTYVDPKSGEVVSNVIVAASEIKDCAVEGASSNSGEGMKCRKETA